jgi:hypothetical protein
VACFLCRAVEAAAGGEHVRVRGRARDVGDAEPDDGAQAAQPAPTLPRLLDRGRCGIHTPVRVPLSFELAFLLAFPVYLSI